jgi:hypothetical protein
VVIRQWLLLVLGAELDVAVSNPVELPLYTPIQPEKFPFSKPTLLHCAITV